MGVAQPLQITFVLYLSCRLSLLRFLVDKVSTYYIMVQAVVRQSLGILQVVKQSSCSQKKVLLSIREWEWHVWVWPIAWSWPAYWNIIFSYPDSLGLKGFSVLFLITLKFNTWLNINNSVQGCGGSRWSPKYIYLDCVRSPNTIKIYINE